MPGDRTFSGVALASIATGALFAFAGIKGYSIPATLQDIVQGKSPLGQKQATPVTAPASTGTVAANPDGSAIVSDALTYVGHAYKFGGAPGISGTGPWDCSSAVNWVIGHDMGMSIPGYPDGTYNGVTHGPATGAWLLFGTAVPAASAQGGDILVGATHMGIVTGPGEYWSAHDPAEGTTVAPISGFPDPLMFYRRLTGVPGG
jgi:cell wall-associated NlpC family hydrolase